MAMYRSDDPVSTILTSLLPTLSVESLPPALVKTATSLLTQSRSRAANLKPEEEAARAWAICDIACHRLQTRLDLPDIHKALPPCGPKTYKKLCDYLDRALPSTTNPSTPSAVRTKDLAATPVSIDGDTPTKRIRTPSSKALAAAEDVTPTPKRGRKRKLDEGIQEEVTHQELPRVHGLASWVPAAIRHLCRKFQVYKAAPHVLVGVASVARIRSENDDSFAGAVGLSNDNNGPAKVNIRDEVVSSLIIAVFLLVREILSEHTGDYEQEASDVGQELVTLGRLPPRKAADAIEEAIEFIRVERSEWTQMDWWSNVQALVDYENSNTAAEDKGRETEGDGGASESLAERALVYGGPGSMTQARTDWLSKERCQQYRRWKAAILKKIERIERQQALSKPTEIPP